MDVKLFERAEAPPVATIDGVAATLNRLQLDATARHATPTPSAGAVAWTTPRRRRRADYTNGANKDARCASGGRSDASRGGHRSSQSLHFGVKFAIAGSVNDARPACFWSKAYKHLAAQLWGGDAKDLRWSTYCHHQSWAHLWPPHLKSTSSDSL